MKRLFSLMAVSLCLALLVACLPDAQTSSIPVVGEDYLKSAHYFADGWPINFWNCELDDLDNQLTQIAADGFNSIILVVPWREFQPNIQSQALADYPANSLRKIMERAEAHNLGVMLRVGYTWDFYDLNDSEPLLNRFYMLMGSDDYQDAWLFYLQQIYEICHEYDNFLGGFICWEDFWNYLSTAKALGSEKQGIEEADFIGYHDYLKDKYTLDEINILYGDTFTNYSDIYFPAADSPALKLLYEFYDYFLNTLLSNSQSVFPNLSMEVRLDSDLVTDEQGNNYYYSHEATYPCANANFSCAVYGIPMGCLNQGERLGYKEAMEKTRYILEEMGKKTNGKGIYVDQFLFSDNTPGFSHNAQIKDDELNDYLENVDNVLRDTTIGYAVWTYHDYCTEMLYNPQFALELDGWEAQGQVEIVNVDGSNRAHLSKGSTLRQTIPLSRKLDPGTDTYYVRGQCWSDTPVQITITLGDSAPYTWTFDPSDGPDWEVSFSDNGNYSLTITVDQDVYIDNLKVYSRIQEGKMYDSYGNELSCINSIRTLNHKLA